MTYIDLINRFWLRFEEEEISRTEMALFFYLLNVCNRRRWQAQFSLTNKNIMVNLDISENTLSKCRDRLVELNLIKYEKGERNGFSPRYTIVGVEDDASDSEQAPENASEIDDEYEVTNEDEHDATNDATTDVSSDVNTEVNSEAKTEANSEANTGVKSLARIRNHACKNKTKIKNKIKTKDYFNSTSVELYTERAENEKIKSLSNDFKNSVKRNGTVNVAPPTNDEIVAYFRLNAAKRINDWQGSAQRFFDYFAAVDWRDKYNRRITSWTSRANNWIADELQQSLKSNYNENRQNSTDSRRGHILTAYAAETKDYDSTF
jgi:hypothetical protein